MNDVNDTTEKSGEKPDTRDFVVELGVPSSDTRGGYGQYFDGIPGGLWGG